MPPPWPLGDLSNSTRKTEERANDDEPSIAFVCHPETIRKNDLEFDETAIGDGVMDRIDGDD